MEELILLKELTKEEMQTLASFECAVKDFLRTPCTAETRLPMYDWYNQLGKLDKSFFLNELLLVHLARNLKNKMTVKHRQMISSLLEKVIYNLTINKLWRSIGQVSQVAD